MSKALFAVFAGLVMTAGADVKLNGLFTDRMVLQRDHAIPVWGTAAPEEPVTVEFAGQSKKTTASASGAWQVLLDPMPANTSPLELLVSSAIQNQTIRLTNVLVGDVWLCAGQSNMAYTMKQLPLIWNPIRNTFHNDQIRLFKIQGGGVGASEPSKELIIDPFFKNAWQTCTPEFATEFSALAGFFAMKLNQDTGVPIGLLYANRGGTRANMWMPRKTLESKPIYECFLDASNMEWQPRSNNRDAIRAPSHLYNGTIHPLAPFAIKGALWYQGESDSQYAPIYEEMMGDLIASWRAEWGYAFPFLFVQLAPWDRVNWDDPDEGWAWQREAQLKTLERVPHTGMVVITDAGEADDIHPQDKRTPGERLAQLAASLDLPTINADFPRCEHWDVSGNKLRLHFSGVGGGLETRRIALNRARNHLPGEGPDALVAPADTLVGFTLCGPDQVFFPAQARIISEQVVELESPEVDRPLAARYGWANFPLCNLYGGNGMPASPFRTDHLPMPNLTGETLGKDFDGMRPEWGTAMEALNAGDGVYIEGAVADQSAMRAKGSYLYLRSPERTEPTSVTLRVVYFDTGFGIIQPRYDSTDEALFTGQRTGVWKPAGEVHCKNTQQWKVATFELPDARFSKRCNGGDIRLQTTGNLVIAKVYVREAK